MNKNTIFSASPAENFKPPSCGTITTDRCLTHIRDAAHSESRVRLLSISAWCVFRAGVGNYWYSILMEAKNGWVQLKNIGQKVWCECSLREIHRFKGPETIGCHKGRWGLRKNIVNFRHWGQPSRCWAVSHMEMRHVDDSCRTFECVMSYMSHMS